MTVDLTGHWTGLLSLLIFIAAYFLVIFEETTQIRKSTPMLLAAGFIWLLIAVGFAESGQPDRADELAKHVIEEFGELFLFLLVAITFVNALEERGTFDTLRAKLVGLGLSYRQLFWITGICAFVLSAVLDNLTTALVLGAVVIALGAHSPGFTTLGCINVVVAANAGGAFCPFGDITTLMVWQSGKIEFWEFFDLFVPSVINFVVPAICMYFALPKTRPLVREDRGRLKPGAHGVIALFAVTIATAVSFRNFLHLPPALGMMLGFGYLHAWCYYINASCRRRGIADAGINPFKEVQRIEWDTLLFFFGIIFAVAGLGVIGYLSLASQYLYAGSGATMANIFIGLLSAVVDNIPLMFAVLTMDPEMSRGQWLLITLTCGVGGSILSIGSAAGVALMGQAKESYTFMRHLRWSWAIALGYLASVSTHLVWNTGKF